MGYRGVQWRASLGALCRSSITLGAQWSVAMLLENRAGRIHFQMNSIYSQV